MYVNFVDDGGSGMDMLVDIAVDVGGNKQILYADMPVQKGSSSTIRHTYGPLPCALPASSALYARSQCTSTTSSSRDVRVCLHGIVG
jgi:NAD/NADP transhydrogenase alpha subunit